MLNPELSAEGVTTLFFKNRWLNCSLQILLDRGNTTWKIGLSPISLQIKSICTRFVALSHWRQGFCSGELLQGADLIAGILRAASGCAALTDY